MITIVTAAPLIDVRSAALETARVEGRVFIADPTPTLCRQFGFQTLYEMPREIQTEARRSLIREHRARVEQGGAVFDHGVVGWLADWMRWHWSSTTTEVWDAVMDEARAIARGYGRVDHLESGGRRAYDGHAWLDARNSAQIEGLMRHLYDELGLAPRVRYLGRARAA
ncbi:MAG: hypothetical protein JNK67_02800 [Alphaproteobacteria bacterium]|nr:hypothetical protein [Alphaproteobacteria bacterium]